MIKTHFNREPLGPERLITVVEVMRMLHVSRSLVYWLIRRGDLPSVHVGHALRFRLEDVQAYIERRGAPRPPQRRTKGR